MRDSNILESFFAEQHRRWKRRAYNFIHFTCEKAPHSSGYEWLRHKNAEGLENHRDTKKASH